MAPGASLLVAGAGLVNVVHPPQDYLVSFEYRYATGRYRPSPWLAIEATRRDLLVGIGMFFDVPLGENWLLTPSAGAMIYREHDGLGLGDPLEFRVQADLFWCFGRSRVGGSIGHYSNAGIGDTNPGSESIKVLWAIRLDRNGG